MFKVSARLEVALSIVDLLLKVSTRLKWSKRYMGVGVELCTGCRGACGPCVAGRGIAVLPSSSCWRLSALRIVNGFLLPHEFAFSALDWLQITSTHNAVGGAVLLLCTLLSAHCTL